MYSAALLFVDVPLVLPLHGDFDQCTRSHVQRCTTGNAVIYQSTAHN